MALKSQCPYCKKVSDVAITKYSKGGLPELQCPHCAKTYWEDVQETNSFEKRAPGAEVKATSPRFVPLGTEGFRRDGAPILRDGQLETLMETARDSRTLVQVRPAHSLRAPGRLPPPERKRQLLSIS